jgi:hypothetical protein
MSQIVPDITTLLTPLSDGMSLAIPPDYSGVALAPPPVPSQADNAHAPQGFLCTPASAIGAAGASSCAGTWAIGGSSQKTGATISAGSRRAVSATKDVPSFAMFSAAKVCASRDWMGVL